MEREQLDKILKAHKEWLKGNSKGEKADLRDDDLEGADLRWCDLRKADLQGADLRKADLRGADLQGADLQNANLWKANLRDANLRGANLQGANLRDANLQNANIDYSCWPLHCGTASSSIKVCNKIKAQLLYHAFIVASDTTVEITASHKKFIEDNFHKYGEVNKLPSDTD